MLELLRRRRDFRRYWLADAVSLVGDWLSYVAVAVLVVEGQGGWIALAMVLVLHTLPASLASPLAGWLTDRMDARRLMAASAILRGLLTLAMTAAAQKGSLVLLQLCLFVRMAVGASEHTAGRAALKRVVFPDELSLANAIGGATWSVLFALGVAIGGVVTSQVGAVWALVIDAATYFLSAGLLLRLPSIPPASSALSDQENKDGRGLRQALTYAWQTPPVRALACGKLPISLATGGAWVFLNHTASQLDVVRDTALSIGVLQTARAIGTGLGPFVQRRYDGGSYRGLGAAAVVWLGFLAVAIFSWTDSMVILLVAAVGWGMSAGANWVNTTTGLLAESPPGMEGRLSSLDVLTQSFGLCVGALAGAGLGEWLGSTSWLVGAPLGAGIVSWFATQWPLAKNLPGAERPTAPPPRR